MKYLRVIIIFAISISSCGVGELIEPNKSSSYFLKSGKIYYAPNGNWFEQGYTKCDADLNSFEVLSQNIAKDKHSIFFGHTIQDHVDYNSFSVDSLLIPKDRYFAYDQTGKLNKLNPIEIVDVDVPTLMYANNSKSIRYNWAKDKNHYYFKLQRVSVDYNSLVFINEDFFYDKDSLYTDLQDWKIQSICPIKDKPQKLTEKYVLHDGKIHFIGIDSGRRSTLKTVVTNGEKKDVKVINGSVLNTGFKIIYYGDEFPVYDVESFQLVRDNEGGYRMKFYKDKKNVYLDKEIIPQADPESFQVVDLGFSKDRNNVYHKYSILKDADCKSFKKKSAGLWGDKNGNNYDYKGNKK